MTSPGRLGRLHNFDERSRSFAIPPTPTPPAKDVLWRRRVAPYDQGSTGSCTIQGLCGTLRTAPHHLKASQARDMATEARRLELYADETAHDAFPGGWPAQDTGSSVLDAMKLAVRRGYIASYEWAFTADQAAAAIAKSPLEVGVNWYEAMDSPNGDGVVDIGGDVRGGHAFSVIGRVATTAYGVVWVCVQSWGPTWPVAPFATRVGRFAIRDADFHRLRAEQGEVARPVPLPA